MINQIQANLTEQLTPLVKKRYSGILKVRASDLQQWKIYLRLGRLVWIESSYHSNRCWQRHLTKYCPQVGRIDYLEKVQDSHYQYLTILFEQKSITQTAIKAIIHSIVLENLFDIFQQEEKKALNYSLETLFHAPILTSVLKIAFTLVDVETSLKQTEANWEIWKKSALENFQPNLAPKIKNKVKLQQHLPPLVYQNFLTFINGNNTFRDLAFKMNTTTYKVVMSLKHYIYQDLLELVRIDDIIKSDKSQRISVKTKNNITSNQKLLIAIDDSKVICQILKEIVEPIGHKFIGIHQPLQAIPTLISTKPDLIFLDLAMPLLNGYEICSQIRRVSLFKTVPIIILTSNAGMNERAKSKAVGANNILSKPIQEQTILKTLNKYLSPDSQERY